MYFMRRLCADLGCCIHAQYLASVLVFARMMHDTEPGISHAVSLQSWNSSHVHDSNTHQVRPAITSILLG